MHVDKNIFFLVVIAFFGIVRALTSAAQKAREKETSRDDSDELGPPVVPPRVERNTDEERVREFLEALGQPPTAAPPPPVVPRDDIPPRPLAPVQPPPEMRPFAPRRSAAEKAARRRTLFPAPSPIDHPARNVILPRQLDVITAEQKQPEAWLAEETRPPALPPMQPGPPKPGETESWRNLLTSPGTLRTAVILREIFGPPLALQGGRRLSDT